MTAHVEGKHVWRGRSGEDNRYNDPVGTGNERRQAKCRVAMEGNDIVQGPVINNGLESGRSAAAECGSGCVA